jgi:hypothetical protein
MVVTRSAHLLFLLGDLNTPLLLNHETGDSLVSLFRINRGENEEIIRFPGVSDPPVLGYQSLDFRIDERMDRVRTSLSR